MDAIETEMLLDDVASVVKLAIESRVEPLMARIAALEKQVADAPKIGAEEIERIASKSRRTDEEIEAIVASCHRPGHAVEKMLRERNKAPELPDIGKMIDDALGARLPDDMEKSIEDVVRLVVSELPEPVPGKSVTVEDVQPLILAEVEKAVGSITIPVPKDGIGLAGAIIDREGNLIVTMTDGTTKNLGPVVGKEGRTVTLDDLRPVVAEEVEKRVSELPEPEKGEPGKDVDMEFVVAKLQESTQRYEAELAKAMEATNEAIAEKLAAIPTPKDGRDGLDGKDVDMAEVEAKLAEAIENAQAAVSAAIAAIPEPIDGKDGRDGVDGAPGEKGADGIGLTGALLNKGGDLIITLSNGNHVNVGMVCGWDGVDVDIEKIQEQIARTIKELWDNHPKPQDGKDGLGFDDMRVDYDGRKTVSLVFSKDGVEKSCDIEIPVMIYRGVWKEGEQYQSGDTVTWGGSAWVALKDTTAKPDNGKDWVLAVKKGKDGKDYDPANPTKPGPVKL